MVFGVIKETRNKGEISNLGLIEQGRCRLGVAGEIMQMDGWRMERGS